jgi:hypothetical protein
MSGVKRLAEVALVFPGIGAKKAIQMVNRVVVPRAALAAAKTTLARTTPGTPVISIEDLS